MTAYFLAFLGGIALFMYGMQLMGDGLQKAAGAHSPYAPAVATGRRRRTPLAPPSISTPKMRLRR